MENESAEAKAMLGLEGAEANLRVARPKAPASRHSALSRRLNIGLEPARCRLRPTGTRWPRRVNTATCGHLCHTGIFPAGGSGAERDA